MRETLNVRIPEEHAARYLPDDVGTRLGDSVRSVVVFTDEPLYAEIGRLQREFRSRRDFFFLGWSFKRVYSADELEHAQLFHVRARRMFEPAGEECGTEYADEEACSECGSGARQVTPLFLNGRRVPPRVDFARTIADELIVSARVVDVFRRHGLSGAEFDEVRLSNKGGEISHEHRQLRVVDCTTELDAATLVGEDPFDTQRCGRCSRGDLAGLNLLSEVSVRRHRALDRDVAMTRQWVGIRMGLLRPHRVLLLSAKAWRAVQESKLVGLDVEVAKLV